MLVLMTGFFWNIIFGNIKELAFQEVQQNGRFALTKIIRETKKAIEIDSPSPGSSSDSLILVMADSSSDPTVFEAVDGNLMMSQGKEGPYQLTSDQVIVSSLQFTNLSYPDGPGTIRIEMKINQYQASIDLKSTASLFLK